MNSKCFKDLNLKCETLKFLEGSIGEILHDIAEGKNFLNGTPIALGLAPNINRWDYRKRTYFCKSKETITVANVPEDGRKSFPATHRTRN